MLTDDNGKPMAVATPPYVLFSIDVELQRTIDLADPYVQSGLGVSLGELVVAWRLMVAQRKHPITHALGSAARDAGIEALLVPSAKYPGSKNLVIILDQLSTNSRLKIIYPTGFPTTAEIEVRGKRPTFREIVKRSRKKR